MTDTIPDWELLPRHPAQFFGLNEGFNLQELRKAYAVLAKRFNPEVASLEFQRIRNAYETLNEQLRYIKPTDELTINELLRLNGSEQDFGQSTLSTSKSSFESSKPESAGQDWSRRTIDFLEGLSQKPASEVFHELKSREHKTAYDYFVLAILSEIDERDPLGFARWLLTGLSEFENDSGLLGLLQQFLANRRSSAVDFDLVELISQSVQADKYYLLTTQLWLRLIREADFDDFQRALTSCESRLIDLGEYERSIFYLRLLRPAIWKADDNWLEEKYRQIDCVNQELPYWAQTELEFLDLLRTYRVRRAHFLRQGAVHARIDRAIVDFCTLDELNADRKFLEAQYLLAASPDDLLRDMPLNSPNCQFALNVWKWITQDVSHRMAFESSPINPDTLQLRISDLAADLAEAIKKFPIASLFRGTAAISVGFLMVVVVIMLGWGGFQILRDMIPDGKFWIALRHLLLFGGAVSATIPCGLFILMMQHRCVQRCYETMWRQMLVKFLAGGSYTIQQIIDDFIRMKPDKGSDIWTDELQKIAEMIRADTGLQFYAASMQLLKD
jgi:hypothetical protein